MKIIVASDHHGVGLKGRIIQFLKKLGYQVEDYGPNSEELVDYPLYAFKVAESVQKGEAELGILFCGTGIGMSIAANKVKGIRCAKIDNVRDARLAKEHNGANVIAFSHKKRYREIKKLVETFLKANVLTDERHTRHRDEVNNYNM